jgi:hypothetical protein
MAGYVVTVIVTTVESVAMLLPVAEQFIRNLWA